jgi:polyisoprenoid-binding protein YceI
MKGKMSIIAIIICVFVWPSLTLAQTEKWVIDEAHSSIYFDAKHTYATVRGLFNEFSGSITVDTENEEKSQVEFEVDVDSINTNITKRDNHLRSDEFFAAGKFPVMTFKSTHVKHVGDNQYILNGDLTVKGITREVTAPFTYFGMRENPLKKGTMVAGFEADFTINRLDYGVGEGKFYKMGVIEKTVRIVVSLEVLKDK